MSAITMTREQLIEALEFMDAGVFLEKFRRAMSEVALNTAVNGDKGKVGKVTLEFTFNRQGQTHGMNVVHKITMVRPDSKGKTTTETAEMTPFYVRKGGILAFVNEEEGDLFAQQETPK